jgi:L-Ala-D/L-Glu epimerase
MSRVRLSLSTRTEALRFKQPLKIAGRVFEGIPGIRVTLDDGEFQGRGEAGGVFYLGDDVDHMLEAVERARSAIEQGVTRAELLEAMPAGGGRNAVDAALWELEARRTGVPVWKLAGLERPRAIITTFTLGADEPSMLRAKLEGYSAAKAIKLKLDGDVEADAERLRLIRALRRDIWLMADANQGYTSSTLSALLPALVETKVALLEQPLKRGCEAELAGQKIPVPLAADESLQSPADLPMIVGRFQVANIKLDKCGGLTEALLLRAEALRLGLKVMVGNMGGSSLAAAPAFLLGQACDVVDLDGPLFLAEDLPGGARYEDGRVFIHERFWGYPHASCR